MEDKELIAQLQYFKTIKPRKDWVILTKNRILEQKRLHGAVEMVADNVSARIPSILWRTLIFGEKLAFGRAGIATFALVILIGSFGFVQNSLPGDAFYPIKKSLIQGRTSLLSQNQAEVNLRVAVENAQALKEAAKNNDTQKLAPILQEYQANLKQATMVLKSTKDGNEALKIAALVNQLEKDSRDAETSLNTGVATQERKELASKTQEILNDQIASMIEKELQTISTQSLTDEQKGLFDEAKREFDAKDYAAAVASIERLGWINK